MLGSTRSDGSAMMNACEKETKRDLGLLRTFDAPLTRCLTPRYSPLPCIMPQLCNLGDDGVSPKDPSPFLLHMTAEYFR
jgi:hypothetical protein